MKVKKNFYNVSIIIIFFALILIVCLVFYNMRIEEKHEYTKEMRVFVYEVDTFLDSNGDKYQRGLTVYNKNEDIYIYLLSAKYPNTTNIIFSIVPGDNIVVTYDVNTNQLLDFWDDTVQKDGEF